MACKFCEIGRGRFGGEVDQPILESADYYAVSSIGGFVPGWTLIFPKKHKLNLASDYLNPAFQEFVQQVTAGVTEEFGQCVYFEHGAVGLNSQTGCGVNHAHFHIVPLATSIEMLSVNEYPEYGWQRVFARGIEQACGDEEYLFCSDDFVTEESYGRLAILNNSESQFFRKLIATSLGLELFYDYKKYRFDDLSAASSAKLRTYFARIDVGVF